MPSVIGGGRVIVKELLVNEDAGDGGAGGQTGRSGRLQAIRIRILPRKKQRATQTDLSSHGHGQHQKHQHGAKRRRFSSCWAVSEDIDHQRHHPQHHCDVVAVADDVTQHHRSTAATPPDTRTRRLQYSTNCDCRLDAVTQRVDDDKDEVEDRRWRRTVRRYLDSSAQRDCATYSDYEVFEVGYCSQL